MDKRQAITILLSGAPGTGKSTIQRLAPDYFRARYGDAAAIGTDEIYTLIDPAWTQKHEHWKDIARANCLVLTRNMFQHGVPLIVIAGNALYSVPSVNALLQGLLPISQVFHFTLDADLATLIQRIRLRGDLDQHPQPWCADWLAHIRSHYGPWTAVIETTHTTPSAVLETMDAKIERNEGSLTALIR